ncbi:MAG: guanylate kinase [Pseudomonadota bacterium]
MIIISGPSGVGKNTLIERWLAVDNRLRRAITCTTRPPRPGEQHGRDYFFLTKDEFDALEASNSFLDSRKIYDAHYGLSHQELARIRSEGFIPIVEVDVVGGLRIANSVGSATTIFLRPPNKTELKNRILQRGAEAQSDIEQRIARSEDELKLGNQYQYNIINDGIDDAVASLMDILEKDAPRTT